MVTKFQIDKLSSRIDALEVAIGEPHTIKYRVYLHYIGETEQEFLTRYPDYDKDAVRKHPPIILDFDSPVVR